METKSKMMKVLALGLLFLVVGFFSSEAYPWGFATHTYINDHLGKTKRNQNMDEIYGAVAPDAFEYLFNFPSYLGFLSDQTHTEFLKVWNVPRTGLGKSLAYGFVTHNDVWGADSTAHRLGLTFGQDEGYIIAKAKLLAAILDQVPAGDHTVNGCSSQTPREWAQRSPKMEGADCFVNDLAYNEI